MSEFLLPAYLWIKSAHLIFVISWMIGLMYLPRLFIYHFQAQAAGEPVHLFKTMQRRLIKGIMTPSMIATWVFGLLMIMANPAIAAGGWFVVKFILVLGITGIHGYYSKARKSFEVDQLVRTEKFWRIMNEVPFIGLIIIVVLVIVKPF